MLQQARQREADRPVRKLRAKGRPPYPPNAWLAYLMWQRGLVADYGGGIHKADFYSSFIRSLPLCREYALLDKLCYGFGAMETVRRRWPAVVATSLGQSTPVLNVRYYVFQGMHDYQTPYCIARRYVNEVKVPQKYLFTFTSLAHSSIFRQPPHFYVLFTQCADYKFGRHDPGVCLLA